MSADLGLPLSYIRDESNWVSLKFAYQFTTKLIELTGDPELNYNAGKSDISPETVGSAVYFLAKDVFSLSFVLKELPVVTRHFNRITQVKLINSVEGHATYSLKLRRKKMKDLSQEEQRLLPFVFHYILSNTLGYYEAVLRLKQAKQPSVTSEQNRIGGTTSEKLDEFHATLQLRWEPEVLRSGFVSKLVLGGFSFGASYVLGLFFMRSFEQAVILGLVVLTATLVYLLVQSTKPALERYHAAKLSLEESQRKFIKIKELKEQAERVLETYKKFVPKKVISKLGLDGYDKLAIGQKNEHFGTALFSDIRGFTRIAEERDQDEIVRFLNEYYELVNAVVQANDGYVDNYLGDGFFAIFERSPTDAIKCSFQLISAIEEFNRSRSSSEIKIEIGVGVASGQILVATVGGADRMQITHLSDAVNTASRLEDLNKEQNTNIVVDAVTHAALPQHVAEQFRSLGAIQLRGKQQAVTVWAWTKAKSELAKIIPFF